LSGVGLDLLDVDAGDELHLVHDVEDHVDELLGIEGFGLWDKNLTYAAVALEEVAGRLAQALMGALQGHVPDLSPADVVQVALAVELLGHGRAQVEGPDLLSDFKSGPLALHEVDQRQNLVLGVAEAVEAVGVHVELGGKVQCQLGELHEVQVLLAELVVLGQKLLVHAQRLAVLLWPAGLLEGSHQSFGVHVAVGRQSLSFKSYLEEGEGFGQLGLEDRRQLGPEVRVQQNLQVHLVAQQEVQVHVVQWPLHALFSPVLLHIFPQDLVPVELRVPTVHVRFHSLL